MLPYKRHLEEIWKRNCIYVRLYVHTLCAMERKQERCKSVGRQTFMAIRMPVSKKMYICKKLRTYNSTYENINYAIFFPFEAMLKIANRKCATSATTKAAVMMLSGNKAQEKLCMR